MGLLYRPGSEAANEIAEVAYTLLIGDVGDLLYEALVVGRPVDIPVDTQWRWSCGALVQPRERERN